MARYDSDEFARELERVIKRDRNDTMSRGILYDEASANRWDNESMDEMIDQAEFLFVHLERVVNENSRDLFSQSVELITDFHAALIADNDNEIWNDLDNKTRAWVDKTIDEVGGILKRMMDRQRRDGRNDRNDRGNRNNRDRGNYRKQSRNSSSRDSYLERRKERGYGRSSDGSNGDRIGQRSGDFSRYQDAKARRESDDDDMPENVVHYNRKPRDFRNNQSQQPETQAAVPTEPVIISSPQLDIGFRYTPNLGQVAHFLYDIRKVVPLYEVLSNGPDAGKIMGETFVHINGERGRQIMSEKGHSGYLFTNRRGPRTDDTDTQAESITKVYRRLLQEPEKIEDIFDQLEIEETKITAKPGAKLPTTFNRVPLIIGERIDVGQATTYHFPSIILDYVEKHVKPVDSSFDVDKSIIISTLVVTSPFSMVDIDEDTVAVKNALRSLETRNSVSAIVSFMHALSEYISLRDWNYVNDQLTDVANQVANIEFGIPVKINSFTTEIKNYLENVEARYGRSVAEAFSERAQYMARAGLATYASSDGVIEFAYNTKVILLPIESTDLTIGLANADQATGIVSQANFPDLHDGLKKIIDNTENDIAKILIILRDGTELTVHHSTIGNSILLHRKD